MTERLRRMLAATWPFAVVTMAGLWVLWPIPAGHMPLSADHTVHLTRIWMVGQQLADGQLRGWSPVWFFGTPVGELYPVLGDLGIVAIRALGLGSLSWPQAYALGFSLVYLAQGWVLLRVGRAMGLNPVAGVVAALLVLFDAGAYREGGWEYTVTYGVWPQTLATSLSWWAFGELALATEADDMPTRRRRLAVAAVAMGASLLAHPMSMLTVAVGGPLLVVMLGIWNRQRLQRAVVDGLVVAALAVLVAAWWLVPMLMHRGWMASYGWLWLPLDKMVKMALDGHFAQYVPTPVTAVTGIGLVLVALAGSRFARFVGAFAVIMWLLASEDAVWSLRLDRLSQGFAHIQYQRFITVAKPGLFLMAGAAVAMTYKAGQHARTWSHRFGRPAAVMAWAVAVALVGWMAHGQIEVGRKRNVGRAQLHRSPKRPALDEQFDALAQWMAQQWSTRDRFFRTTVDDARNTHWFMDAPVYSGMPLYKQGFTPGDNFVHKPEAQTPALLDALQVRYVVTRRGGWRGADLVASFGSINVFERRGWQDLHVAWLDGPGTVEVLHEDVEHGEVRVRVDVPQDGEDPTRLVFGVAGHPRWQLQGPDGSEVEWVEAPVIGSGPVATIEDRKAGVLRGGKAHGDDGTEPTLIAAPAQTGEYVLTYRARTAADVLALLASVLALAAIGGLVWRPQRFGAPERRLQRLDRRLAFAGRPVVIGSFALMLLLVAIWRQWQGAIDERDQAVGWALRHQAEVVSGIRPGFFKTDMLIRPAMVVDGRRNAPAAFVVRDVELGEEIRGWVGIDDDAAKVARRGSRRVTLEARPRGEQGWTALLDMAVRHRPGLVELVVPTDTLAGKTVDLRVVVTSRGEAPPPLGFDLELGGRA